MLRVYKHFNVSGHAMRKSASSMYVKEMKENNKNKQTVIVTTVCVIYLSLTIFYHHIDKYLTGIVFFGLTLLIPAALIMIFVYAIKGLSQIIRNRKNLTFKFAFLQLLP